MNLLKFTDKRLAILAAYILLNLTYFWYILQNIRAYEYMDIMLPAGPLGSLVLSYRYTSMLIPPFILSIIFVAVYTTLKRPDITLVLEKREHRDLDIRKVYRRLSDDERSIVQFLFNNDGQVLQSDLTKMLDVPRYKVSRMLNRLENIGVLTRQKYGMTNIVILNSEKLDH